MAGSTGVLGRNAIPRLLEHGHQVRALVRREPGARRMRSVGVEPVLGDLLNAETLPPLVAGCDAVLHLATAIPRPGSDATWEMNDRIRREGTRNLLQAAKDAAAPRYVQQSITLLYGSPDVVATEETPLAPPPFVQSAADMEAMVSDSGLDWCILRGGVFYGPGTGADREWRAAATEGGLVLPGDGRGFISLNHVADMARAVVMATEAAASKTIYNVVDDLPVTYAELFRYIADQEGAPPPREGGDEMLPSLRCSNDLIVAELGWEPAFPSYRSGLAGWQPD